MKICSGKGNAMKDKQKEKEKLFERFGEMDLEELNKAAEGLKEECDLENLKALALENGLDPEDVADYVAGNTKQLATLRQAALGRIKVQEEKTKIPRTAAGIIYGMARAMTTDPEACRAFMKKGSRVDKVWSELEKKARDDKQGSVGVACGTDRDLKEIILKAVTG
nr:MAG TPA: DNA-binding protein [Caudoviricetes sp.]